MKKILLFLIFLLTISAFSFAQTYHEDDKEGLRIFLRQPSAIAGQINAQRLGLQQSDTLNWQTQEAWVPKILNLQWNNESPKRLIEIEWVGNFNDPNATNLSGNLDCSKWAHVSKVSCGMNQIVAIEIINCFALIEFYCRYNSLATLIVNNCPVLTRLWLDFNQLTTANIFNCPNLELLRLSSNLLTAHDINNCTSLSTLRCNSNKYSTLNMNNIPALSIFDCGNNLLTSINLSNNPALTSLDCSNNPLTTIDLSANTALQKLYIGQNQLTTLDLSHNPLLNELHCNANQFTSLDLTANTSLSVLNCSSNPLTSLHVPHSLGSLTSISTSLPTLDLSHCTKLDILDSRSGELTTLNVNNCEALRNVNCQNNNLDTLDLSDCKNLSYLDCNNNKLTSLRIANTNSLYRMDCSNNQLTHLDVSNNTALAALYCSNNWLKTLDITNCTSLCDLDCRYNNLNALDISTNKVLHALWCNNNQFYFSGLPPKLPVPWEYVYWPQNTIEGGIVNYELGIDLSREYLIAGNITQFSWFDITDGEETPLELNGIIGFFPLTEDFINKRLRCKMTNATFPMLMGSNILVYEVKIQFCEAIGHLEAKQQGKNSILLTWSKPESNSTVAGYSIYRNEQLLNNELLTICFFLDENLLDGKYDYYVETHYTNGCVSDSSNHVKVEIEVGIKEKGEGRKDELVLYPNPTTCQLSIVNCQLSINNVEVFDIYGRKVLEPPLTVLRSYDLTILHPGIYFIKIATENGTVTKKIIKQ